MYTIAGARLVYNNMYTSVQLYTTARLLPPPGHRLQEGLLRLGEGSLGGGDEEDEVGAREEALVQRGVG